MHSFRIPATVARLGEERLKVRQHGIQYANNRLAAGFAKADTYGSQKIFLMLVAIKTPSFHWYIINCNNRDCLTKISRPNRG